jgi:maltose O-acetyltransferase
MISFKKIILKYISRGLDCLFEINHKIRYFYYRSCYDIDSTFKFNGVGIKIYGDGKVLIGKNSYFGSYTSIQSKNGSFVKIGNNCSISHNVRIYTANRDPREVVSGREKKIKCENVLIGDNVWIGANVFIVQGVTIGNNVVVGANSVVTSNIPSNVIAAGVPARILSAK